MKILSILAISIALALNASNINAQTNQVPNLLETNSPAPTIAGGLGEIGRAISDMFGGTNNASTATNWCLIPYFAHDFTTKKNGAGAVLLYSVTENFWAGVRAQELNGQQNTAGVQGQLQLTRKIGPLTVTPFAETTVGLGSSALYGNVGAGALVNLFQVKVGKEAMLGVGLIADYEHYVNGASGDNLASNGNQGNIGALLHISW
jgi:hypothetical protein